MTPAQSAPTPPLRDGVSFVVTIYNKLPFLPAVLAAIDAQTGDFAREIVLVDDGSTDGSLDWARNFAVDRIDVRVVARANGGCSAALNSGVEAATLAWIKPVDADDLLAPDATQALLNAARRENAQLVFGRSGTYDRIGLETTSVAPVGTTPSRAIADPIRLVLETSRFNPSSLLVATELYRGVGGCDPRLRHLQDYSLAVKSSTRARFAFLDAVVFLGPAESPGRVSDNKAGMYQNLTLVLHDFLRDTPTLPGTYARYAARRALGRAAAYARRHGSHPQPWKFRLAKLATYLPLPLDWRRLVAFACSAYGIEGPRPE